MEMQTPTTAFPSFHPIQISQSIVWRLAVRMTHRDRRGARREKDKLARLEGKGGTENTRRIGKKRLHQRWSLQA